MVLPAVKGLVAFNKVLVMVVLLRISGALLFKNTALANSPFIFLSVLMFCFLSNMGGMMLGTKDHKLSEPYPTDAGLEIFTALVHI